MGLKIDEYNNGYMVNMQNQFYFYILMTKNFKVSF